MAEACIIPKRRPIQLRSLAQLSQKVRDTEFSHIEVECTGCEYVPRFFRYRETWYDTHQFERIDTLGLDIRSQFTGWAAVLTESAFSAILLRRNHDDDTVTVAYTHW